jgi:hypothetical protein
MPQIDLYLDSGDERMLIAWLIDSGARLIPDLHYASRHYVVCSSLEQVLGHRSQTRSFFVVRNDFSLIPLELVENRSEGKRWYFIMPRNGGPAITLLLGGEFMKDGFEFIRPGNINFYRNYWDPIAQQNNPAPAAQKAFIRDLRSWIEKNFQRIPAKRPYWGGRGALSRVEAGAGLIGLD